MSIGLGKVFQCLMVWGKSVPMSDGLGKSC